MRGGAHWDNVNSELSTLCVFTNDVIAMILKFYFYIEQQRKTVKTII